MGMETQYAATEPKRAEIEASTGPLVLEFGSPWCGYCRRAQPLIAQAFGPHTRVRHLRIEDGQGRPLGRSFRVKLWPTLIFLRDGVEQTRVVRPMDASVIREALERIDRAVG